MKMHHPPPLGGAPAGWPQVRVRQQELTNGHHHRRHNHGNKNARPFELIDTIR